MSETTTRTWGNLILETRANYGSAARRNRGAYTGQKVHRLVSTYIVGVVDEAKEREKGIKNNRAVTLGGRFLLNGDPVLFSCAPACGCTQGQMAGSPNDRSTIANVTCEKCKALYLADYGPAK